MPFLGKFLFIANNLILNLQNPVTVVSPAPDIWFSSSQFLEAQSLNNRLVMNPIKTGVLHAFGLKSQESQITRIVIVSSADFKALQKCPQAPYDFAQSPVGFENPVGSESMDEKLKLISACGFENFSLSEHQMEILQPQFGSVEKELERKGFRILAQTNLAHQRELTLSGLKEKLQPKVKTALGPWSPFYSLRFVDGPKPGRTLIFNLTLFQFSRSKAASLGLKLPEELSAGVNAKNLSTVKVNGPSFNLGADFGESQGIGQVIARPQIRTKPGEKAIFQSGGEIPIRQNSLYANSTQWKNYGLQLEMLPDGNVETGAPEISMAFKLELSEPDMNLAADGVPGLTVRRLESRFDLRINEATVLSTMIQTMSGTRKAGPTGLASIPIIGNLFANHSRIDQDSELWFAIEPRWDEISSVPPLSYGTGI